RYRVYALSRIPINPKRCPLSNRNRIAMSQTAIIVPARLGSTRFPRKLLHSVRGRPLILWTAERIRNEAPDLPLHFAVGEQELADVLVAHGYSAILTDPDLPSGT